MVLATLTQSAARPFEHDAGGGAPASITSVIGLKGGVGKTTVAINLAAALAHGSRQPVPLLDFNWQAGDVATLLNVRDRPNISAFAAAWPAVNAALVDDLLRPAAGGIRVLAAPDKLELAELITRQHVASLLDIVAADGGHVVVDHPPFITDASCEVLERSHVIIYVLDSTFAAAGGLLRVGSFLDAIGVPSREVLLVLNRADRRSNVSRAVLEQTVRIPIAAQVPEDESTQLRSERYGKPAFTLNHRSTMVHAFEELASLVDARTAFNREAA